MQGELERERERLLEVLNSDLRMQRWIRLVALNSSRGGAPLRRTMSCRDSGRALLRWISRRLLLTHVHALSVKPDVTPVTLEHELFDIQLAALAEGADEVALLAVLLVGDPTVDIVLILPLRLRGDGGAAA